MQCVKKMIKVPAVLTWGTGWAVVVLTKVKS